VICGQRGKASVRSSEFQDAVLIRHQGHITTLMSVQIRRVVPQSLLILRGRPMRPFSSHVLLVLQCERRIEQRDRGSRMSPREVGTQECSKEQSAKNHADSEC